MANVGPITDLHLEYAIYGDFCLTKKGTLLGALELDGRDADGLNKDDFVGLSLISRSIYLNLPESVKTVSQYYIHLDGAELILRDRQNPVSQYLSQNRQTHLNKKNLTCSKIIHFFEIEPDENLTDVSFLTLCKHLSLSVKDKDSRRFITKHFSPHQTIVAHEKDLKRQHRELAELLHDVKGRWDSIFKVKVLNINQLWAICRFLANLDSNLFFNADQENVPSEEWDLLLAEGDRKAISVGNHDFIKLQNTDNTYARIFSVARYGEKEVTPALWVTPTSQKGNYVVMTRYSPLSKLNQTMMFGTKKRELKRKNIDMGDIFSLFGSGNQQNNDRYANLKPQIKEKMKELEKAEGLEERWGHAQAAVLVFGKETSSINNTGRNLRKSMINAGLNIVSESVNLPEAFRAFMPAGSNFSVRNMDMNCTQFGAASLIYKSSEGQRTVEDLGNEEAQYIFTCPDGTLFHYSPCIGGKAVVICVGPIRSGKTFTKNTIASHFPKYGGIYRAIDIDPGTETLAKFYRDDGAIFRIGQNNKGFNNFAVASDPNDLQFIQHQKQLIIEMLKTNDNEEYKHLEMEEQHLLDTAILDTLHMPPNLRSLSTMIDHCPKELQNKLSRWRGKGMYASLFDQKTDAVGDLTKPVVVFNLAGLKEDRISLPLAMSEITYRVTRMFEDPEYRNVPKFLDIDEAHEMLKLKYMRDYLIRKIRTWGKHKAGIGLWSQDPHEFKRIEDWSALRSAASTLFFMADPNADTDLYKSTFKLTNGEIEAIRNLKPKKEAYIIQREISVSKTVIVDVEPEQHVINTSQPDETALRDKLIIEHGLKEGIKQTISALAL